MSLPPLFETVQKKKEIDMRKRSAWMLIVAVSALVTGFYTVRARATPGTAGYASSTLALGRFGDVDVMNHQVIATNAWRGKLWDRHMAVDAKDERDLRLVCSEQYMAAGSGYRLA